MPRCNKCPEWIRWVRSAKSGKMMPINERPDKSGNVYLDVMGLAHVLRAVEEPPEGLARYMSHFSTCGGAKPKSDAPKPSEPVGPTPIERLLFKEVPRACSECGVENVVMVREGNRCCCRSCYGALPPMGAAHDIDDPVRSVPAGGSVAQPSRRRRSEVSKNQVGLFDNNKGEKK